MHSVGERFHYTVFLAVFAEAILPSREGQVRETQLRLGVKKAPHKEVLATLRGILVFPKDGRRIQSAHAIAPGR